MPKKEEEVPVEEALDSEIPFRGRFYLTMIDTHLKVVDIVNCKMFDLLSEPHYDNDSVSGMALMRSMADRLHMLFVLCSNEDGSFLQKIEFNYTMTS